MKRLKFMAVLLAACLFASVFASCTSQEKEKEKDSREQTESTTVKDEEETSAEETKESAPGEEATEESYEVIENTESTEATEATIDTSLYQSGSYFDVKSDNELLLAQGFFKCREWIEELHAENPDYYFVYGTLGIHTCIRYGTADNGFWTTRYLDYKGEEQTLDSSRPVYMFSYEDIMAFPMALNMGTSLFGEGHIFPLQDSIDDGTYYSEIIAMSVDGTKALIVAKDPIILTPDEFYNLKPGDRITIPDSDPLYSFDLTIRDGFDPNDPYASDPYEPDKLFINFEEEETKLTYTFKYTAFRFLEMEDGNYILGMGPYNVSYAGMNPRMAIVDIAPDCEIIDGTTKVTWINPTQYGFSDGINNVTKSFFYYANAMIDDPLIYNDWIAVESVLEPCVIENNTITKMTLPAVFSLF